MKNALKNNPDAQPDLLNTSKNSKPIASAHATAHQLSAALGFADLDETFLRNRAAQGVIPKPIRGLWDINATTLGLLKWYRERANAKADLPTQYANMQAMENALGLSKKSIKWLLKHGAGEAQDPSNRIAPLPVIRLAFDIIAKVADGQVTGIDSLEEWNHQTELAKKLRLESEQLRHDQLIRDGETLMSRDASYAVTELVADQLLWEKRDQPLRAALLAAPKNINRQHRTILKSAAVAPAVIGQCETVTTQTISAVLDKLRTKIPKRMNLETVEAE